MQKNGIIFKDKNRDEIPCCHFCNSKDVIKYGKQRNKVQRYLCNTCHKIFNERYGTLFYKKGLKKSHFEIFKSSFSHHLLFDMPPKKGSQKLETTAPFR